MVVCVSHPVCCNRVRVHYRAWYSWSDFCLVDPVVHVLCTSVAHSASHVNSESTELRLAAAQIVDARMKLLRLLHLLRLLRLLRVLNLLCLLRLLNLLNLLGK